MPYHSGCLITVRYAALHLSGMAPSIGQALRQVKEDLAGALGRERIEGICREVGYRWRRRVLDPFLTIHLL